MAEDLGTPFKKLFNPLIGHFQMSLLQYRVDLEILLAEGIPVSPKL